MSVLRAIFVYILLLASVSCQGDTLRPRFPDVFQTEIEGLFFKEKEVVEIDASLFYDKANNRAAFQFTLEAVTTRSVFNFDTNEEISFGHNECTVSAISDDPNDSFFPFSIVGKKKKIAGPDTFLFFDKSEFDAQELYLIPTLVYKAKIDIPKYQAKNCDVMHLFSKRIELPNCKSTDDCKPTLMTISVKCKDDDGSLTVDHTYKFYRFIPEIVDQSVFQPPPGIHCSMKSTKELPSLGPYFSFSFDTVEKLTHMEKSDTVFSTHSEIWYEKKHQIIRIDDYGEDGVLTSSRVIDASTRQSFIIVPITSTCYMQTNIGEIELGEDTGLPEFLFSPNNATSPEAVYVGKRSVNGLTFEVWSSTRIDHASGATVVEEVYFLEIIPDQQMTGPKRETYLKISHVDISTYEENAETQELELSLLKHIPMNNFRTDPKEWSAFDVSTCFNHEHKKKFYVKVNGSGIIRESKYYVQCVEHLYDKLVQITGASPLRFSELTGEFDGNKIVAIKGSIIDNHNGSGFALAEPGMYSIFNTIKNAAKKGELAVSYDIVNNKVGKLVVLEVLDPDEIAVAKKNCYSGASLAAASLVLLALGTFFGIAGYYVFMKRKRSSSTSGPLHYLRNFSLSRNPQ